MNATSSERPYRLTLLAADSARREAAAIAARIARSLTRRSLFSSLLMHVLVVGGFCTLTWQMPVVPPKPPTVIDMDLGLGPEPPRVDLSELPGLPPAAVAPAPAPDAGGTTAPLPEPAAPPPAEPEPAAALPPPPEPAAPEPPAPPAPEPPPAEPAVPEPDPAPPEPAIPPSPAPAPVKVKPPTPKPPKPKPVPVPKPPAAKPPPPKPAPSKPVPPKPAPPTPPAPPAPSEPAVKPAFVPLKRLSSLPPKAGPKPARIKPAGESEAERISRIRGGLKRTDLGRAVAQALASPGGAPGGMAGGSFDAAAIGSSIRGQVRNAITTGSFSTQGGGRATASQSASYFADLSSRLHSLWNQPSRSEIGGGRPRAVVSLTIAGDGRVLGTRLTRPSNRPAMDASIQSLLAGLSRLAAPADFGITGNSITVVVNFELD